MKYKMKDGRRIEFGGISGYAVTGKEDLPSGDVAVLDVDGRHGKIKTTLSDRLYYVTSGSGKFTIKNESFAVEQDDVVIVPKDTEYDFEGNMKVVVFCAPAFDPSFEVPCE